MKTLRCHGIKLPHNDNETIYLDPKHYPGGISLWSLIPTAYNTTTINRGILVHARIALGGCNVIDKTFVTVFIRDPICMDFIRIDEETASSYVTSCFLQIGGGFFAMKWPGFDRPL